jgi:ProP effector
MDETIKFTTSKEVITFLAASFPACFSLEGDAKPLKIGIFQDLAEQLADEPRVSKTLLRSSLRHYTNSWRYLHSVKEGSNRVDLQGNSTVAIEKEHAEHAQQQLAESKERAAQRRKDKLEQQGSKQRKNKITNGKTALPSSSGRATNKHIEKSTKHKPNGTHSVSKRTNKASTVLPTEQQLIPGTPVTVKLGKVPMYATVTELTKDGVQVQLQSGMSAKVKVEQLRLAKA